MKVCILTAGTGSRLGERTTFLNKSLVSVAGCPTLTRSLQMFPSDTEFVIALGYRGELVKEYLTLAHPERKFQFVDVFPFDGPESGLGLSLLNCRPLLQEPFIFLSCDTLVEESVPPPTENWMGYGDRADISSYRTVELTHGLVTGIQEKGSLSAAKPYIGLAGILDQALFWRAMESGSVQAREQGEVYGLRALLLGGVTIRGHAFTWYDTGTPEELQATRLHFTTPDHPDILEKPDESIWFVGNKVIKYSNNEQFIRDRVHRAAGLRGFVPQVAGFTKHMYAYPKVDGSVLSRVITVPRFQALLRHCQEFWQVRELSSAESVNFYTVCNSFYQDKTRERIKQFYDRFHCHDGKTEINGRELPPLDDLLAQVDWSALAQGLPVRFHGDFHFENILWSEKEQRFVFLDWRQNFGGIQEFGDIYYDLAKLLHGLIINHGLIVHDAFSVNWEQDTIRYDFLRRHILIACQQFFDEWLNEQGYDRRKVYLLTALIFLNIAALHHHPYCLLLYALGKDMLANNCLENATFELCRE